LSYEFNKNKHRNTLFSNAQLFIYGSDLGIIWRSNDLNIDPDFYSRITPSKSIAAGINVSF
jgi:TonB-dependent starch-binding outer membrane protein SusC